MEKTILELQSYNKVILYGVGRYGKRILRIFRKRGFDESKLIVWDENYAELGVKFGYTVSEPQLENFFDKAAPVIIAVSPIRSKELFESLKTKFEQNGFLNFVTLNDILMPYKKTAISSDEFNKIIDSNTMYDCEYQDDIDFTSFTPKVKTLAYYLPQFHDIPENDKWWGKGFTEWTNIKKAKPLFNGHYQPREPHEDFGYYNLTDADVIRKQAQLAKRHGIYGWCIYYYWFSGKRLLEKPIDILLANKDIDINFCFEWANETWTKRWIGNDDEVAIEQKYLEDDPEKFIDDIKKYIDDPRYIRVDGRPMLLIYTPQDIPNPQDLVARWRKRALDIGIGELYILVNSREYSPKELMVTDIVDGAAGFCHHNPLISNIRYTVNNSMGETVFSRVYNYHRYTNLYCDFVKNDLEFKPYYRSCIACWDNTPRYDTTAANHMFACNFSLKDFYRMVATNVAEAEEMNKEFMFVFSWNEWCEGSCLEPDKKYGYAVINTLSKAIMKLPFDYTGK